MAATFLAMLFLLAPPSDSRRIELNSYAFGKRYSVSVTQAALDKAPVWKDEAENPPLAARKAMKLAGAMKDKLVKDTDDFKWVFESVSLNDTGAGQWYWLVNYEVNVKKGGMTGIAPNLQLIVLMDGTVIEPKVSNDR